MHGSLSLDPDACPVAAKHVAVGLDAGGSKTSLLAQCDDCSGRIERRGPPANPQRGGLEESAGILGALVQEAVRPCQPIEHLSVCAGVAGAGRTSEQEVIATRLRRALTDEALSVDVQVVHDASIALDAAFGSESGLVVIAGTGSVVFGRATDGTTQRAGGWGHLLGDAGSGYAIGRAGLRAVAEAFDGGAETALRARLGDQYGIDTRETLIHQVYQEGIAIQDVAPLVIDAAETGDAVASDILATQTTELARQVEWLLAQIRDIAPRTALLGGMLQNPGYARRLHRTLRDSFPDWSIERLQREPAVGALRRARRQVA